MKLYRYIGIGIFILFLIGTLVYGADGLLNSDLSKQKEEYSKKEQINKFVASKINGDKYQLTLLVDSLLNYPAIDPNIITRVRNKIDSISAITWEIDTNPYPAHHFYGLWNTLLSHPYPHEISKNDSSLQLILTQKDMLCDYNHPHQGHISSEYGWRGSKMHNGVDIKLETGDSVQAAFKGVVRLAKWQSGYGRTIIIRHHNGLETIYAHLNKILVESGDFVDPGQIIGLGGNSGHSSGSHLHFETRFKGVALNPQMFIDFDNQVLKNDTLILKKIKYGYAAYTPGVQFHTVKNGDYLYKIATEHGLTLKDICDLNGIKRNHYLIVGDQIRVSN
jgi:murein DD-endopeptidase MepM/ murein hydrolase activator NlpD